MSTTEFENLTSSQVFITQTEVINVPTQTEVEQTPSTETFSLSTTQQHAFEAFKRTYFNQKNQVNQRTQDILSNLQNARNQMLHSLTSIPSHPYEKLKYRYLSKDTKIPTLDEIKIPKDFNLNTVIADLSSIAERHQKAHICQIEQLSACLEEQSKIKLDSEKTEDEKQSETEEVKPNLLADPNAGNLFATLSGDKFVVDNEKAKKHMMYLEFLKSIQMNQVSQNPEEIAKKILVFCLECYK